MKELYMACYVFFSAHNKAEINYGMLSVFASSGAEAQAKAEAKIAKLLMTKEHMGRWQQHEMLLRRISDNDMAAWAREHGYIQPTSYGSPMEIDYPNT